MGGSRCASSVAAQQSKFGAAGGRDAECVCGNCLPGPACRCCASSGRRTLSWRGSGLSGRRRPRCVRWSASCSCKTRCAGEGVPAACLVARGYIYTSPAGWPLLQISARTGASAIGQGGLPTTSVPDPTGSPQAGSVEEMRRREAYERSQQLKRIQEETQRSRQLLEQRKQLQVGGARAVRLVAAGASACCGKQLLVAGPGRLWACGDASGEGADSGAAPAALLCCGFSVATQGSICWRTQPCPALRNACHCRRRCASCCPALLPCPATLPCCRTSGGWPTWKPPSRDSRLCRWVGGRAGGCVAACRKLGGHLPTLSCLAY